MKLIEILRKLGIIRVGAVGGTYKNYKEMPDGLMSDDIPDSKNSQNSGGGLEGKKRQSGSMVVFFILFLISLLFVVVIGFSVGISFWFFVAFVLWILFFFILLRYRRGVCAVNIYLPAFVFFLFFTLILVFANKGEKAVENGAVVKGGDVSCQTLAKQYDGKILKISSAGKLKGQIGLKINQATCDYEITWQEVFEAPQIIKNIPDALSPVSAYSYVEDIVFAREGKNPADGTISPVFANKEVLPLDPFNIRIPFDYYSTPEVVNNTNKNATAVAFSHVMQQTGTFSQSIIDDILSVEKIKIFDVLPVNGDLDTNTAVRSGKPIAEFDVSISE